MSKVNSIIEIRTSLPYCFVVLSKYYGVDKAIAMLEVIDLDNVAKTSKLYPIDDGDAIWSAFTWDNTPQGYKFWHDIARYIESKQVVWVHSDFTSLEARVANNLSEQGITSIEEYLANEHYFGEVLPEIKD